MSTGEGELMISSQITDPSRLAELREMNSYTGQPGRCEACGASKRAPGLCCIVCGKPDAEQPKMLSDFRKDIEGVINRYSRENGSNTPDFILAQYLVDCLSAYDKAVTAREKWYGREPKPVHEPFTPVTDAAFAKACAEVEAEDALTKLVKGNGFTDVAEFHSLVASVNMETQYQRARFRTWQEQDGSKVALLALIEKNGKVGEPHATGARTRSPLSPGSCPD